MTDGLKGKYRKAIIGIFSANKRVERVVLFGSRAMGTFTPTSDVDIVLFGDELTLSDHAKLVGLIGELPIPQQVDILRHKSIKSEKLLEHIQRHGMEWYRRDWGGVSEWKSSTLGACATFLSGGTPAKRNEKFWGGTIPWVSAKDMKTSRLHRAQDHITDLGAENGTRLVTQGTTLLLVRGMTLHNDIPICFTERSLAFNQDIKALVANAGIDKSFLYYWITAQKLRLLAMVDSAEHGTGRLNTDQLKAIPFSVPPEDVQRAIAHILGSLDDKIELNRQMNRTLEQMAQAIFKSWFIDFDPVRAKAEGRDTGLPKDIADLFPDGFENSELGEIPKGWEVKPIGDVVQCVGGATPSTKKVEFWDGGTNPFLTPKDMSSLTSPVILDTDRHITDAGVEKINSKRLPVGTVILSSRAPIGYLAINEVPVSVNQGIIAMICSRDLPNYYVLLWTMTNMEAIKGRSGGTTFAEISKKIFRPIPVLIPMPNILDAFTKQVEPLFQQVVENVVSTDSLARLRDTLLPKLISGELPIPNAENNLVQAIKLHQVHVTDHADEEAQADALVLEEIFSSISRGEIIEDYPTDRPYPSCLVYGDNDKQEPIHSVWAYNSGTRWAVLITVYRPDPKRWINWRKRRKDL